MITLDCTKCGTTLSVDDGFAGGVCRCSSCGTIQTVPARGQSAAGGEAIFERAQRGGANRDLDALGEIVSGSGLIGSGMLRQARRMPGKTETRRRRVILASVLGASVAVIAGTWVALGMGHSERDAGSAAAPSTPVGSTPAADATPAARVSGPSFGPIALNAGSGPVVYLVDRGDATRAYTESLQRAVVRSVATLGAARTFQVRFWTSDGESPAFPPAPAEATAATVAKVATWMREVEGGRATDASASLDATLATKPAEIVILTGKAWQLDDSFANEAIAKLGGTNIRVHGIALGGSSGSDALARVASKSGGRFVEMDGPALAALAK